MLTRVERVIGYTVSKRIFDKLVTTITDITIKFLVPFKDFVLMISADSGKEFTQHKGVSKALDCGYYFEDPIALGV